MPDIVLLRHGESTTNLANVFTGWTDVDLTPQGVAEAHRAGQLLQKHGFRFDVGYTSYLKRTIKTMDIVLEELDLLWIPVQKTWRLNERFYGALQGQNKAAAEAQYGAGQVLLWRRDPYAHPPAITPADPRYPGHDPRYQHLTDRELPLTENLSETLARVLPFWTETVMPALRQRQKVIVCAHGNSLRALVQYIDKLTDEQVTQLDIVTGVPMVYQLNDNLERVNHYLLTE